MDDKRNNKGYYDPTPYKAIKNITSRKYLAHKVIKTIYNVAHLAGFRVEEIRIRDESTGEEYTK